MAVKSWWDIPVLCGIASVVGGVVLIGGYGWALVVGGVLACIVGIAGQLEHRRGERHEPNEGID